VSSRVRLAALAAASILTIAASTAVLTQPAEPPPGSAPAGFVASAHLPTIGPSSALDAAADQYQADVALVRATLQRDELLRQAAELERLRREAAVLSAGHTGVDWDSVARCETGGNWQHQTQYDGGLGILHAAWVEFGGREFAEYGSQATREQQIVVAERIYARHGLSGWGCRAYG
jgi:hypothetical protein